MTNYIITQTEIHHVTADSVGEAHDLWNEGVYDCATSINVEIVEADFKNDVYLDNSKIENEGSQLLPKVLQIEAPEWDNYPSKDEPVTVTFGTLKTVQNEEILKGVQYAMDYLEDINYHDGANALSELFDILKGTSAAPEWQSEFFSRHPLYSVPTE